MCANKIYHDTLKQEFKDSLYRMVNSERSFYHMYAIDRLCTQGVMIGFDYDYIPCPDKPGQFKKVLHLGSFGDIIWELDYKTGYAYISGDNCIKAIKNWLEDFSTLSILN